jgi:L-threonylcarbamoyladenylate synthase
MTIDDICNALKNNHIGIVAHDTVPGIIGLLNAATAQRIINAKQRSTHKGFIVLIPNKAHLPSLTANIPPAAKTLIDTHWPGPLTLILPKHADVASFITGSESTIAVRYPKHPLLNAILSQLNTPLLTTSANISGANTISQSLLDRMDFVHPDCLVEPSASLETNSLASTIVDATQSPPIVLRAGQIVL